MTLDLNLGVGALKGVGKSVEYKLAKLNIYTLGDLLGHYPRRYEDFSKVTPIRQLNPGPVTIKGEILQSGSRYAKTRRLHITEAIITDGTGTIKAVWFNQPHLKATLPIGAEVFVSGKLEFRGNDFALQSPEIELASQPTKHTARIVPIYSETAGLSSKQIRTLVSQLSPRLEDLPESMPRELVDKYKLMPRTRALAEIHLPTNQLLLERARYRLAFEELFFLMLASLSIKHEIQTETAPVIEFKAAVAKEFVARLPFTLTSPQRVSAWQTLQDLEKTRPMNRLLEGDVGSGKTVVAVLAALMAMEQGYQVALMVPTEVLAKQHAKNIGELIEPMGYRVTTLIGRQKKSSKTAAKESIKTGGAELVIGTQALLGSDVEFTNLGLVIVDEQHRFGVNQRQLLKQKAGYLPHLLSMTATPIPRSLALTVYGDLDISVIDELPPGRKPVITKVVGPKGRDGVYKQIDLEIAAGRQVFVVCPLIEDPDSTGVKSVEAEKQRLEKTIFKHRRLGLLHGRLSAAEKDSVMAQFSAGKIDILVTTSVIEVGIDQPNASIIVIEAAERFGLAALHQLRGRVGRSSNKSYCYLISDSTSEPSLERIRALEKTNDGFRLAQIDLEVRGPGQIYGLKQHGQLDLRLADISDTRLLVSVREAAEAFLQSKNMIKYPQVLETVNKLKAVTSLD